jgi:hypothetical protein
VSRGSLPPAAHNNGRGVRGSQGAEEDITAGSRTKGLIPVCELHPQRATTRPFLTVREICWGLLLIAWASPLGAGEPLAIKVSPAIALAPATLFVRATIESHAGNRAIEVVADSGDFYRSSLVELEGEYAPRMTVFELRNLPRGHYTLTTRLIGVSGQTRSLLRHTVNVTAP